MRPARARGRGGTSTSRFPPAPAGDAYEEAWNAIVLPVLRAMAPDWILVSAGFDGHADDPLANVNLREPDYGRMGHRLAEITPGRLVFFLEGGYDLGAISGSVEAALKGVGGEFPALTGDQSPPRAFHMVKVALSQVEKHWSLG